VRGLSGETSDVARDRDVDARPRRSPRPGPGEGRRASSPRKGGGLRLMYRIISAALDRCRHRPCGRISGGHMAGTIAFGQAVTAAVARPCAQRGRRGRARAGSSATVSIAAPRRQGVIRGTAAGPSQATRTRGRRRRSSKTRPEIEKVRASWRYRRVSDGKPSCIGSSPQEMGDRRTPIGTAAQVSVRPATHAPSSESGRKGGAEQDLGGDPDAPTRRM